MLKDTGLLVLDRALWRYKLKYNLKGPECNLKVRRPKGKRLDPKYTRGTGRAGNGKGAMVWGCFSGFSGVRPIHRINDNMDQFFYRDILEEKMDPHADNNMSLLWTF